MNKLVISWAACMLIVAGCGAEQPARPITKETAPATQSTIVKKISVSGFDPDGEPEIREMSDGTLVVMFNFMPPSFAEDKVEEFADFDKQLEKALGVPVQREDRERFLIRNPAKDTAEKARVFLEGYRNRQK